MTEAPGWYKDPTGSYSYRYWDGARWTDQVSTGGGSGSDPNPIDPGVVNTPPAPGTAAPGQVAAQQPTVQVTQSRGSGAGTVVAVVLGVIAIIVVIALLVNASGEEEDSTPNIDITVTTQPASDS